MPFLSSRSMVLLLVVAAVTALATIAVAALLVDVFEHKQEAARTTFLLVPVSEEVVDPETWGLNWPRQYDGYRRTSEPTATKYGGGSIGPEGTLPPQKAERDPWLTRLFAGYLFAVDYRDRRGHAYMLQDQELTKRNLPGEGKQSGNCLHCHASILPLYRTLGREALPQGEEFAQLREGLRLVGDLDYWEAHDLLARTTGGAHPVSCVDCHDPRTMALRVTRPGFLEGIRALALSSAAVPHLPSIERWRLGNRDRAYDPNTDGTRQEMRSFVCGQCHVEYYCGKGQTLFFPWSRGLAVEQVETTYNETYVGGARFKDWVHAETGVAVLKAQHPEFELWSQGVHARSGVACADCHMPYKREGAMKLSEHWVRSPLLQLNRACASCHPYAESELAARVEIIQDRHFALLQRAGQVAVAMLDALVEVRRRHEATHLPRLVTAVRERLRARPEFLALGVPAQEEQLQAAAREELEGLWRETLAGQEEFKKVAELQRAAQWRLDFVAAENSMGFHAPQEMARILAESIDLSRQAQVLAARLRVEP